MQKMSEKEAIIELKRSTGCGIYKGVADVAIQALEEVQQYSVIGTVDQCREAVERMKAKKVIVQINDKDVRIGRVVFAKGTKAYICQCGNRVMLSWKHCAECGQKIDWSE